MENDPLSVLVRKMTPEEELESMAAKLSRRMESGRKVNYPIRVTKLSVAWVAWNRKEMDGDDFAYLFGKIFHTETLAEWSKYLGIPEKPKPGHRNSRKNWTKEDYRKANTEAQRRFRASHPTYYKSLRESKNKSANSL